MARSVSVALAIASVFLIALADGMTPPKVPKIPEPPKPPKPPNVPEHPKPPKPVLPVKEKCRVKSYHYCYNIPISCPVQCPRNCYIDCVACKPVCLCNVPWAVCQDPRFIGADGITFYFHGKKDGDFCLVSDTHVHINAHFMGKRNLQMTRDFTWIQSLAIFFGSHKLYLSAMKTAEWRNGVDRLAVTFDESRLLLEQKEGATWKSSSKPTLSITRTSNANGVVVEVDGVVKVTANVVPITAEESRVHNYGITEEDCFAHLEVGFKFYSLTSDVHGVLGQTYRDDYLSRLNVSSSMPLMGGEGKFVTSSLFSSDCHVGRFGHRGGAQSIVDLSSHMDCQSRIGGRGIVCKR